MLLCEENRASTAESRSAAQNGATRDQARESEWSRRRARRCRNQAPDTCRYDMIIRPSGRRDGKSQGTVDLKRAEDWLANGVAQTAR